MVNSITNDIFDYSIVGVGLEPLCEGKLEIVCKARDNVSRVLEIRNSSDQD